MQTKSRKNIKSNTEYFACCVILVLLVKKKKGVTLKHYNFSLQLMCFTQVNLNWIEFNYFSLKLRSGIFEIDDKVTDIILVMVG